MISLATRLGLYRASAILAARPKIASASKLSRRSISDRRVESKQEEEDEEEEEKKSEVKWRLRQISASIL